MIPYLQHIAILVTGGFIFYKLFLEKETFFQVNRWILLVGVITVVALPFLQIPVEWSLRNHQVEEKPKPEVSPPVKYYAAENKAVIKDIDPSFKKTNPNDKKLKKPGKEQMETITPIVQKPEPKPEKQDYREILIMLYFIGFSIFALNFLIQLSILAFQICTKPKIRDGSIRIIQINKNKAPFSFWSWVFINPSEYDPDTFKQILQHEQIHISEKHTLDILLAEMLVIIQWFNPFAWYYRKAVENNLEYLTDQKMLVKGTDRQAYQMSLLRVAVPDFPLQLTSNYNQSFLKKRISMMNTKKSSLGSAWKYLFLFPLIALSVLCLNAVKTNASDTFFQKSPEQLKLTEPQEPVEEPAAEEKMEPVDMEEVEDTEEPENASEEIDSEDEAEELDYEFSNTGNWSATIKGNEICFSFKQSKASKKHNWYSSECFNRSAFQNLPIGTEGTFEKKGDAGTIVFKGKFVNNEGEGTYTFTENTAFRNHLTEQGFTEISEDLLFHCVLSGVDKAYLSDLKREGFKVDDDNLRALAHIGPSVNDLKKLNNDLKGMGYSNIDLDDLISLTIHEVDVKYIKDLKAIGYPDLGLEEVVQASIHDISPAYFKELKAAGVVDLEFEELLQFAIHDIDAATIKKFESMGTNLNKEEMIQFAIHDIEPAMIEEFKNMGFRNLSNEEIIQAAIHDITPAYFAELKAAGMAEMSMDEITSFAIHDINAATIQKFKNAGLNLSKDEMVSFAIHGIEPATIEEFKNMGFRNLSNDEIIQASIHGITPAYFAELKAAGMGDMSMEEITQFGIHDIDATTIQKFKNAGLNLSKEEMVSFAIHDIEPSTIESYKKLGFRNLSNEEIIQASIHDVDAKFITSLHNLGFKNASMTDLVHASIHDVDAEYIKAQQAKGKQGLSLKEYVELKISSYRHVHDDEH